MDKGKHIPYVPEKTDLREFTVRAVVLGLVMTVVLGAANAYLGLKAGMTIAATYPAAVIGMAVLRLFKGTILEENIARTVGSVGESLAAGAIFTIPAFLLAGVWDKFDTTHYMDATMIMAVGGILGILFVTMLRRVMVEDAELPYPESVAAGEIHKAGRRGGTGARYLFGAMATGAVIQLAVALKLFAYSWEKFITFGKTGIQLFTSKNELIAKISSGGGTLIATPAIAPAYIGVGYIIGPRLAALNFAGGVLSWGLFVPLLLYIIGPALEPIILAQGETLSWTTMAFAVWKFMVRPIAIGGMLVSAGYTLFRMRKNLTLGLKRSIGDLKSAALSDEHKVGRLEKDISFKLVAPAIIAVAVAMGFLYFYFCHDVLGAVVATVVMIITGFFFAAVSGYLVGMIGSSNNPISGLTLSTLIIAALLMVILGVAGSSGVAAVLGVAAVVCVSSAIAGEMLQDLKVGHILGGTPWKMEAGNLIAVVIAAAVMFFPLLILHQGDINAGGMGFGGKALPAPQAGLMALLAKGIVGGQMAWPLVIVGMLMAVAMICVQVRSPMLVAVGMYLPFETVATIFVGGMIRALADWRAKRRKFNEAQKIRMENNGVLISSGLIAGEALMGLVIAGLAFKNISMPALFENPSFVVSLFVMAFIAWMLVKFPLNNAGSPDEPAPPSAMV